MLIWKNENSVMYPSNVNLLQDTYYKNIGNINKQYIVTPINKGLGKYLPHPTSSDQRLYNVPRKFSLSELAKTGNDLNAQNFKLYKGATIFDYSKISSSSSSGSSTSVSTPSYWTQRYPSSLLSSEENFQSSNKLSYSNSNGCGFLSLQYNKEKQAAPRRKSTGNLVNKSKLGTVNRKLSDFSIGTKNELSRYGIVCVHCGETQTPEWRRGPYGNRTLCNACGLFYRKLIRKFGFKSANLLMRYRKTKIPSDRRIPKVIQVPNNIQIIFDQDPTLDENYMTIPSKTN